MKVKINNKIINVKVANNLINRFIGLMFKKKINEGLLLFNCNSIHTFFMRDSIDLIMVDKENRIVFFKSNLSKNKIVCKKEAYHTIELPKNTINNLKLGETLIIED